MNKARLILEPPIRQSRMLRLSATLLHPTGARDQLWWELPEAFADHVTPWADPFVIGMIFPIMQGRCPVHIEGPVSPSLLGNLELFMRVWGVWAPGKYRPVDLSGDDERELPPVAEPGLTVASFSGGVDSCFTLYRHVRFLAGRRTRRVAAAVVQHGMDIWLDRANTDDVYERLLAGARTMLDSLSVPCIPMRTNFQTMRLDWSDAWGTQLVSGLHLLAGRYDTALIANDMPYKWLDMPWPAHPVTAPLLGGRGWSNIDDGGDYSRFEKAKLIAGWPQAMRHLHVCFGLDKPAQYENCCMCEKCIRTILAFRVAGCDKPEAFQYDPTDEQIRRVDLPLITRIKRWTELAHGAEAAGFGDTGWAKAVRTALRRHRWRKYREPLQRPFVPLRNQIRKLIRGSERSRREIERDRAKISAPASHKPLSSS